MPRAGLNRQRVIEAGCELADDVGWANLTMAALAGELGVRQPSLYKHVAGLPGLQRAISIQAKRDLSDALAGAAVGRSRADAVRALAGAYRDWAHRHPGLYGAVVRAPAPDDQEDLEAGARAVAVVAAVLAGYGLRGPEAIHATRALRAGLHGFVDLEAARGFGLPEDVDSSFAAMVEGFVRSLEAAA